MRFSRRLTCQFAIADPLVVACTLDDPTYVSLVLMAVPTLLLMGALLVLQLPDYVTVVVSWQPLLHLSLFSFRVSFLMSILLFSGSNQTAGLGCGHTAVV